MWLAILLVALIVSFGGVVLFGAPYLPTLKPQIEAALELAALEPGDRLLELGCGDGRVLIAAAKQGLIVTGYELNPFLAGLAWLRTRRWRHQVRVIWGDFWRVPWPKAEAIFTFLLPKYMDKLDKKVIQHARKPVNLVSFAFAIPDKQADDIQSGVYLYIYR